MFSKSLMVLFVLVLAMTELNCSSFSQHQSTTQPDAVTTQYGVSKSSLTANSFKIPVGQDDEWEITESWAEHCQKCNDKGYDKIHDGYFGDFCQLSHAVSKEVDPKYGCFDFCKYGWDFNLPEEKDLGKSVLASGDGVVYQVLKQNFDGSYKSKGWGNTVTIDHGNNICSRYAHLKNNTITVSEGQQVCQGLKIGEIGGTPNFPTHLHFQFEECDSQTPLAMGFTDGNGIPECIMGGDVRTNGKYTALKRTNVEKQYCGDADYGVLDTGSSCMTHKIPNCPMVSGCPNKGNVPFDDIDAMDTDSFNAMSYLWRECAIAGKSDNKFHPNDTLTRAETLKIALSLFGLTGNCVATESFQDVNPWDWFYPYVLCGIKYGVISTTYSGFNPNDEIHFPEAAKMAVEAAVKAKRAVKKSTGTQHFDAYDVSHWAFQYVETIYAYGGIDYGLLEKGPDDSITRAEFARMIASLSPCFCADSTCPDGCECKQKSYSCEAVAGNNDPPLGGSVGAYGGENADVYSYGASSSKDAASNSCGSGSGDEGMIPDAYVCKPNCVNKNCGSDGCGASCGTCSTEMYCDVDHLCKYKCIAEDCKSPILKCGFVHFTQPGCEGGIYDCGECPEGKSCGNNQCVDNSPPSETVYAVDIFSPGGKWELLTSPNQTHYTGVLPDTKFGYKLSFTASELPAYVIIKPNNQGIMQGVQIWLDDKTLPDFDLWWPYKGDLTMNPTIQKDITTHGFVTKMYGVVMIRIPAL